MPESYAAYLTPKQVARLKGVHVYTVMRWILSGVKVGPRGRGQSVKLAAQKTGGRWRITPAGLADFDAACNTPHRPTHRAYKIHSQIRRERRFDRAMTSLASQGVIPTAAS